MESDHRLSIVVVLSIASLWLVESELSAQCLPEQQRILPDDLQCGDWFGCAVSVADNAILVGSLGDVYNGIRSGSACVFRFRGSGWYQEQKLVPLEGDNLDVFGSSVSIDGDLAVIGAHGDDSAGEDAGAAYVFRKVRSTWVVEQVLIPSDAQRGDEFGFSVAAQEDVIVIGARFSKLAAGGAGAVYVYRWSGSRWDLAQELTASDADFEDFFGWSVSLGGGRIVVGAPCDDEGLPFDSDTGAAYIFERVGGQWLQTAKLMASRPERDAYLGNAIALSGDRIVVGAEGDRTATGAAYVFEWNGSAWRQVQKLTPDNDNQYTYFGCSVALEGDAALIGARQDDSAGDNTGAAYLFRCDGTGWEQREKLVPSDVEDSDDFGFAVALDGETAVGGALFKDVSDPGWQYCYSGAAYVWKLDRFTARWVNYGCGWPGSNGIPSLTMIGDPVVGMSCAIVVENSNPQSPTPGLILAGLSAASIPARSGGRLDQGLGGAVVLVPVWAFPTVITGPELRLRVTIPPACALLGLDVFMEALEFDPGASHGVSFTPGMALRIGLADGV